MKKAWKSSTKHSAWAVFCRLSRNIQNIQINQSLTCCAFHRTTLNRNSIFLHTVDLMFQGSHHGTVGVYFILSISLVLEETKVQQRYNGSSGETHKQHHSQILTILCLLSLHVSNKAMLLQGNGICTHLFYGDMSIWDGVAICKLFHYLSFVYLLLCLWFIK